MEIQKIQDVLEDSLPEGMRMPYLQAARDVSGEIENLSIDAVLTHATFVRPNLLTMYFSMNLEIDWEQFFAIKKQVEQQIDFIKGKKTKIDLKPVDMRVFTVQVADQVPNYFLGFKTPFTSREFKELINFIKSLPRMASG